MRQLVYTIFISNNRASFHLWWKENLVKHQRVSKYYENDTWSYRNQSIDLLCKSVNWFLYERDLPRERGKTFFACHTRKVFPYMLWSRIRLFCFSVWVFFMNIDKSQNSRGRGRLCFYILFFIYHFHLLQRHLDISWVIATERSPLRIADSRTRNGNLWFPYAIR